MPRDASPTGSCITPPSPFRQDVWRLQQLEKSQAAGAHPYSKFGTGSVETLAPGGAAVFVQADTRSGKTAPNEGTSRGGGGGDRSSAVPEPSPQLREALIAFHKKCVG